MRAAAAAAAAARCGPIWREMQRIGRQLPLRSTGIIMQGRCGGWRHRAAAAAAEQSIAITTVITITIVIAIIIIWHKA